MKKNLVLLGMMGVGKTTLGKIIAKKQGLEFIDTDANIEKSNLMTINEIFKEKGEKFFRIKEEIEVVKCLKKNNCVIALGGGAFMSSKIRATVLKSAISIWLHLDLKVLTQRIKWNQKRPLLNSGNIKKKIDKLYLERKKIEDLFSKRRDFYKLADYKIICDKLSKEYLAKKIIDLYEN